MPFITPPNYLVAPVDLPATTADPLTTEGGSTLDDGSGNAHIATNLTVGATAGEHFVTNLTYGGPSGPYFAIVNSSGDGYGISQNSPGPPGIATIGGYYSGFAVNGTTSGDGVPLFGVLASNSTAYVQTYDTGVTQHYGTATTNTTVSSQSITSGTAFTPNSTFDSDLCIQFDAASAGSWSLSMGPSGSGGTTHTIFSGVSMAASTQAAISQHVPAGWEVVVTLSTVTVASATVITK